MPSWRSRGAAILVFPKPSSDDDQGPFNGTSTSTLLLSEEEEHYSVGDRLWVTGARFLRSFLGDQLITADAVETADPIDPPPPDSRFGRLGAEIRSGEDDKGILRPQLDDTPVVDSEDVTVLGWQLFVDGPPGSTQPIIRNIGAAESSEYKSNVARTGVPALLVARGWVHERITGLPAAKDGGDTAGPEYTLFDITRERLRDDYFVTYKSPHVIQIEVGNSGQKRWLMFLSRCRVSLGRLGLDADDVASAGNAQTAFNLVVEALAALDAAEEGPHERSINLPESSMADVVVWSCDSPSFSGSTLRGPWLVVHNLRGLQDDEGNWAPFRVWTGVPSAICTLHKHLYVYYVAEMHGDTHSADAGYYPYPDRLSDSDLAYVAEQWRSRNYDRSVVWRDLGLLEELPFGQGSEPDEPARAQSEWTVNSALVPLAPCALVRFWWRSEWGLEAPFTDQPDGRRGRHREALYMDVAPVQVGRVLVLTVGVNAQDPESLPTADDESAGYGAWAFLPFGPPEAVIIRGPSSFLYGRDFVTGHVRDFSRDELQIARASREDELIRQWLDPDPTSLAAMAEGDGPPSFPTAELSELRAAVQDSATHEQEAFGLGLTIPV